MNRRDLEKNENLLERDGKTVLYTQPAERIEAESKGIIIYITLIPANKRTEIASENEVEKEPEKMKQRNCVSHKKIETQIYGGEIQQGIRGDLCHKKGSDIEKNVSFTSTFII